MKSALYWLRFGVYVVVAITMLVFGALLIRHVYVSLCLFRGELAFLSLLLGVILLLVGGGLLFSTLARSIRRAFTRSAAERL
jgi:hypothetical protein